MSPSRSLADVPEMIEIVRAYAAPIPSPARPRFYELVDRELGNAPDSRTGRR